MSRSRLASGRPVMDRDQITDVAKRIMKMASANTVVITVTHTARVVTRMANSRVMSGDDGDELAIDVWTRFGEKSRVVIKGNQLDDGVLRSMVQQCESVARDGVGSAEEVFPRQLQVPDVLLPNKLWFDETIEAMGTTRGTVIPEILGSLSGDDMYVSGFLGLTARSEARVTNDGISVFSEETDSEVTVTVRGKDRKSSGWAGQAARNWSTMQYADVAAQATKLARMSANPVALEPGRRTAILGPAAVNQLLRHIYLQFDAFDVDQGMTALSRMPHGNKLGQRIFDRKFTMSSDPADPEGGFRSYFANGHATPAMTWVENGILKNMAYSPTYAMKRGKAYAQLPFSVRVHGGATSIEEMIARCEQGVYVNRFSNVELLDLKTGLLTGVTRDGCFLVKNGKIDRPIKNFRFMDSPFFFFNNVEAIGPSHRAAFGYTPNSRLDRGSLDWPRSPMIVPPMMVRDFNFSSLADAV